MKRELNFAVILLFLCCSSLFYSCNNGGSPKTETTTDSAMSSNSSDTANVMQEANDSLSNQETKYFGNRNSPETTR